MGKRSTKKYDPLREKSFHLAVRVVKLCKYLREQKKEYVISKQIIRSGTNPGAMVREAANAESATDFIHKLAIGQKETGETQFWLELLYKSEYISAQEFQSLYADSEEVMKLIRSSILTKKQNLGLKAVTILVVMGSLFYLL